MDPLTDDDLVRMHRAGDPEAFNVLFDRYGTGAYSFALAMLRNPHAAEDALQDAMVAMVRALPTYTPQGKFRPWVMRIVRNRCLNRIEADRACRVIADTTVLEFVAPRSAAPAPFEHAAARDTARVLQEAMHELPVRQREAIALYAFEDMRYHDIADVLELPINTVKTLIHRARAALAQAIQNSEKD